MVTDGNSTGFTYGKSTGATYGSSTGGTYGNQLPDRYRIRLTAPDGRRSDILAIESLSVARPVSAIGDFSATVPRGPDLSGFALANADLFYGDQLLFQARAEVVPGPGTSAAAQLSGRGVGRRLARRELSVTFDGATDHEAIHDVWEQTDFEAQIVPPANPGTVTLDRTGTALEILQRLHEQAGMAFVIRHDAPGLVAESFVPGENVRTGTWTRVDDDSEYDLRGYANKIIVEGKLDESAGTRPRATAEDSAEVEAIGLEEWFITDPELTSTAACQTVADTELADRTTRDDLSGEIDIIPELVTPGYTYEIPTWNGVELPVTAIQYDISRGDASATLEVNSPEGLADYLASLGKETETVKRLV